ncbi:MAG: hypothetical protein ACFFE8_10585 [Candidatus Heimdallarchaeota archaeon]
MDIISIILTLLALGLLLLLGGGLIIGLLVLGYLILTGRRWD